MKFIPRLKVTLLISSIALSGWVSLRTRVISGQTYVNMKDIGANYGLTLKSRSPWFELSGSSGNITVHPKRRTALFNGLRIEQNFPVAIFNGIPMLSFADWRQSIRPLLDPRTNLRHRVRRITIDMGHGGKDAGASGKISKEKNLNLLLGMRVCAILRSYGFTVFPTRSKDIQIPLEKVGVKQQRDRSDLFVSIHMNSALNRQIHGIEVFCLTPAGAPSSGDNKIKRNRFPGNRFDSNNILLAYNVQKAMLSRTGAADRGIKRARFAVLKDLNAPGILIEAGFISNSSEERRLNTPNYREQLARGIVEGIIAYQRQVRP